MTCVAKRPRGKTRDLVTCKCVRRCKRQGRVRCNGTGVNLERDEGNCGDCGRTCRADELCQHTLPAQCDGVRCGTDLTPSHRAGYRVPYGRGGAW